MIKKKQLYKIFFKQKLSFYIFLILFISTFNILSHFVEKKILGSFSIFGDFLIYRCAGLKYLTNESPYGINKLQECLNSYPNSLEFFYSPITLSFFSLFGYIDLNTSLWIWGIFVLFGLFSIIYFSYKFFSNNTSFFIFLLIFFFSFGGLNWTGLITGNISIIIYGLLSLGIFFLHKEKKVHFYSLITLVSIIKPTYIIFILLPLFISSIKEVKNIIFFLTIFLIVYLFSYLQNPILFNEFINHLIYGRSDNFTKIFGEGFGLFSLINFLSDNLFQSIQLKSDLIKSFLWLSICSLIFLYSFLITTGKQNKDLFSKNIAFGICVLTFCYPILKHYECFLAVPSIFFLINSSKMNIKFLLLILMFGFHDKHTLILVLTSTLMLEFYFNKKSLKI